MRRFSLALLCLVFVLLASLAGCKEKTIKDPKGLEHTNAHYRRNTAFWFGHAGREDTVHYLSKTLQTDTDVTVRAAAACSLGKHGDPEAIPYLRQALTDSHWLVRCYVVEALADLNVKEAAGELETVLVTDKDPAVRKAAAESLGRLNNEASLESLIRALNDADTRVHYAAMRSLEHMTGLEYGKDKEAWRQWWDSVHE